MIEIQVLNKLLKDGNLDFLRKNFFNEEYFTIYKDEYNFIIEHYNKYGIMPDRTTIINKFPEFEFIDIMESDEYLKEALHEQFLYNQLVPILQKTADLAQNNSKEAIKYARTEVEKISKLIRLKSHTDIVKQAGERWEDYIKRTNVKGLLGITSGFKELDEITHGWLPGEDLVIILGRTNEGKSWILLFFLIQAWLQGKRVLLYSGEMSANIVGYRFDTIVEHFSNKSLMSGDESIKDNYEKYIEELKNKDIPFIVITPKDLGGKRLDCQTLDLLIEEFKPDIIGIDQISLMTDYRAMKGDPTRIQLTHISEDLYHISEERGIPILVDAQASRKAVDKKKKDIPNDEAPEIEHVNESDGIGQNASRIISIKQTGVGLKIALKKNRYGQNNVEFLYYWDIDKGILTHLNNTINYNSNNQVDEDLDGENIF